VQQFNHARRLGGSVTASALAEVEFASTDCVAADVPMARESCGMVVFESNCMANSLNVCKRVSRRHQRVLRRAGAGNFTGVPLSMAKARRQYRDCPWTAACEWAIRGKRSSVMFAIEQTIRRDQDSL